MMTVHIPCRRMKKMISPPAAVRDWEPSRVSVLAETTPATSTMGNGDSTEEKKDKKKTETHEIEETSTGFHVFEIHTPTVGFSIATLIFFIIAFLLMFYAYRRCAKRWGRKYHPPQPTLPLAHPGAGQQPAWQPTGFPGAGHTIIYMTNAAGAGRILPGVHRPPSPRIRELNDDERPQQHQLAERSTDISAPTTFSARQAFAGGSS